MGNREFHTLVIHFVSSDLYAYTFFWSSLSLGPAPFVSLRNSSLQFLFIITGSVINWVILIRLGLGLS